MYHIVFMLSSASGHLGCFHVLATVCSVAVNTGVYLQIVVLSGRMSRSGIVDSYGNSVFTFLRHLSTVFHNGCTNLHSHRQYTKAPFSLLLANPWWLVMLSIFSCACWPFICLLWINIYSAIYLSSAHFLIRFSFLCCFEFFVHFGY